MSSPLTPLLAAPSRLLGRLTFALAIALAPAARTQERAERFPPATAAEVGLDPARVEELSAFVRAMTERDEVVGAELLVIRNERTVLHEGYGFKDREERVPMERDTIFCIRSMTKPVVGTAIELLLDAKSLDLDDPVSKYIASFDNDRSRAITIEHLLHHQGGLALSSLLEVDISKITGVREVADMAGAKGPEFTPGERFNYSDDGADTLGALVEVAAGKPLADFIAARIFAPLGIEDAIPVVTPEHRKRPRIASNYAGSSGAWTKYWSPKDSPIFPTLLASQSLYCTPKDYARFLALWKNKGRAPGERLVSLRSARRALKPGVACGIPTGFEGLATDYGELWILYVDRAKPAAEQLVAFGHSGSDGTSAYCFPELDLMVLLFTQARGSSAGLAFEETLQKLLVDPLLGSTRAAPIAYTSEELGSFAGSYWKEETSVPVTLLVKGTSLQLEAPGTAILALNPTSVRDEFALALAKTQVFRAERDEAGTVVAVVGRDTSRGVEERFPRIVPEPGLPSVDELEALRKQGTDWDVLAKLGACRIKGSIDMPARKLSGSFDQLAAGTTRFRTSLDLGSLKVIVALDGAGGWTRRNDDDVQVVEGAMLDQMRFDHPLQPVSSWRGYFSELSVLKKVPWRDRTAYVVRGVPHGSSARTMFVDTETGRLLAEAVVATTAGLGEVGAWVDYDDWRDVGEGFQMPFHITTEWATPLLGTSESKVESVETQVAVDESSFRIAAEK